MLKRIQELCAGNSCRSLIAEAFLCYYCMNVVEDFSTYIKANAIYRYTWISLNENPINFKNKNLILIMQVSDRALDFVRTESDNIEENWPTLPNISFE
ncbi:MAG: hypothetical protein IT267_01105 [Saprospiraceae bacterium]|nr:hypothetical protein [Saprospiraceae bacterium]